MFAWAILAAMMVAFVGLIAAAQPHAGAQPSAAVADAIARDCLAVFKDGNGALTLADGVSLQMTMAQCTVQAPYGVLSVGALADAGNLIGGQWAIVSRNGQYVIRARIPM